MLFAEAVTFDPSLVITIFVIFLLLCIGAAVVVVVGICSAFRAGRDPSRGRATTAWHVCVAIESMAVLSVLAAGGPLELLATTAALTCTTCAAHALGRWTAGRSAPGRSAPDRSAPNSGPSRR